MYAALNNFVLPEIVSKNEYDYQVIFHSSLPSILLLIIVKLILLGPHRMHSDRNAAYCDR